MIVGVGTDLCAIGRMERAARSEHFLARVFAEEEVEYARAGGRAAAHLAASFAAKEALAKACGLGIFRMGPSRAWVVRTEHGPIMRCSPDLWDELSLRGAGRIWLSLTHEAELALAFVVLEA